VGRLCSFERCAKCIKEGRKNAVKLNQHYSMFIQWSEEDQVYIVTVPELPGCKTHGETYEKAVKQGQYAIEGWIEANKVWGRPIPPPQTVISASA
jgi:predicted RNase H-like HicB family nuclease